MISLRRALPATLVVGIFLTLAGTASAASFTVNDPTDAALANPAGTACESTNGGSCTLRAAVRSRRQRRRCQHHHRPGGRIQADDPLDRRRRSGESGDLDVKSGTSVTLTGAGAGSTTLNANHVDREFAVQNGASLSVSGVTIEHGAQPDTSPSDNSTSPGRGGAIYNDGFLFVDRSVLTGNSAHSAVALFLPTPQRAQPRSPTRRSPSTPPTTQAARSRRTQARSPSPATRSATTAPTAKAACSMPTMPATPSER